MYSLWHVRSLRTRKWLGTRVASSRTLRDDDDSPGVVTARSFALIFTKEPNDPAAVGSPRLMPGDLLSRP